ncbi:MAG: serine/threonine-protein kinase [Polyangiaceae bacterium]
MSEATDTLPEAAGELGPGRVVAERYEILEILGRGTSGTVYKARDLYLDSDQEIVALKVIHPRLHSDRQIYGRFRREAAILERLEGDHLCKMLDCVEEDGLLLITLEYVDGPSLDRYLEQVGALPPAEAVEIVRQICRALAKAHEQGVVHRDLKPSNVLIAGLRRGEGDGAPKSFTADLSVRVVDFGLAKIVAGETTGTMLTEQDMVFGTPDYMAPEQVAGEELDGRCDIYAAGVILFELLTGSVPFDTPGALTTMSAHLNDPVPSLRERAPNRGLTAALDEVVQRALAKAPSARFASAQELDEALAHVWAEEGAPDTELESASLDADTGLDHAPTSIGTTLPSHREEAERLQTKGAKVRVVVRDAPPASADETRRSRAPSSLTANAGENRIWTVVAVVAALLAMALGVWLGVR